jgi:hypothetical protein
MNPIGEPRSSTPKIRPAAAADRAWIAELLREHWGAAIVVVHGEVIEAAQLPALVAEPRRGLATYRRRGDDAELVTLTQCRPAAGPAPRCSRRWRGGSAPKGAGGCG